MIDLIRLETMVLMRGANTPVFECCCCTLLDRNGRVVVKPLHCSVVLCHWCQHDYCAEHEHKVGCCYACHLEGAE